MTTVELQREDVRNRLLRRADWRFLLPDPWPARSICFASGPLAVAVELISSQLADIHEGHDCDLAVAVDPNMDTLMSAWNALRAGGSCYTEWYAPLAGGLRSIRRLLGAQP